MTYNPGTPQPFDLPASDQDEFLSNFELLNQFFGVDHVPFGNTVTNATNANPCVCTSPNHGLTTGNTVTIKHFSSLITDKIVLWNINGGPYIATVIDANTFSINANASANPPYLANSGAFSSPALNYGFHKKTFFPTFLNQGPNTSPPKGAPYSAYYTKKPNQSVKLFYQNGVGTSFESQLVELNTTSTSNMNGKGLKTPWGLIFNFGNVVFLNNDTSGTITYDLPIPFLNTFIGIYGTLTSVGKAPLTNVNYNISAVGLTQFQISSTILSSRQTLKGYYLAIGY